MSARCCPTCNQPMPRIVWTRERVGDAIFQWVYDHGGPPMYQDWVSACPDGTRPTSETVRVRFGSWSATIVWAGYRPGRVADRRKVPA